MEGKDPNYFVGVPPQLFLRTALLVCSYKIKMPTTTKSPRQVKIVTEPSPSRRKLVGRAGPWKLVRQLAETNFARLYAATPAEAEPTQPTRYMVKMLRKEWWRDNIAIDLFRREAWVGARVSHPHVVPILSANVKHPPFYAAMPLLEGQTLRQRLSQHHRPTLNEILWLTRQMAEGLAAIWQAVGMVHGDVKPENVMLASTGHATLIDLGFARRAGDEQRRLAEPLMGSLAYIAPEVVTSAFAVGPASDQYSLGVVMYEMLTGRTPFESNDPAELIARHRGQKPPCIRSLRPELPKPIASLVHTLLAKDPIRRAMDYHELIERLVRLEIETFGPAQSA